MINFKKFILSTLVAIWVVVGLVVVTTWLQQHTLILKPLALQVPAVEGWALHHVLGEGCGCSEAIFKYLKQRGPQSEFQEFVTVLSEKAMPRTLWGDELEKRGFRVQKMPLSQLPEDELNGVPFLMVIAPSNQKVYVGGYGNHLIKTSEDIHDLEIIQQLQGRAGPVTEFPIFGCVMSTKYQKILDPFRLKYAQAQGESP